VRQLYEGNVLSFQGLQARYRCLSESAAWRLLRAAKAPFILAFIADLFSDESEIPRGRARIMLDEIVSSRESGNWSTETSATTYLNEWINRGWLREMDDLLTKTDASEMALRFCNGLDERYSGTTASRLRIVQEAVRDLDVATNPNIGEKVDLLESKKVEIQLEINALKKGVAPELNEVKQREWIREIYHLASALTGDFRWLEDKIRELNRDFRVKIIEGDSRGDVLSSVMDEEDVLSTTEPGSAFDEFYNLLCDGNRSTEFREQLNRILNRPVGKQLSEKRRNFLKQLMRELGRDSERVMRVRRRCDEGLRSYIKSGAAAENQTVDRLLSQLEKQAVVLRLDLKTETALSLPVGPIKIKSPESMRLQSPDDKLDTSGVEEKVNSREPSSHVLDCLDAVRVGDIAHKTLSTLRKYGPMSIAGVVDRNPIQSGLEELVAYWRVAHAVGATALEQKEDVLLMDKQGGSLKTTMSTYLLSAELFPADMDELDL